MLGRAAASLLSGLALTCACAFGADAPDPAVTAYNRHIAEQTPQAEGVFAVQDDGTIHHVQSGLVCPAKYPNVTLFHLFAYATDGGKGLDVGCDYGRESKGGDIWSKLTIFAVKAKPGETLDQAYGLYRSELTQALPDAQPQGEALRIENKSSAPSTFPEVRSQEYLITQGGRQYTTELVVALSAGWIVEVRATFIGLPNTIGSTAEGGGTDVVIAQTGDRLMTPKALIDALGTIGH